MANFSHTNITNIKYKLLKYVRNNKRSGLPACSRGRIGRNGNSYSEREQ